MGSPSIPAEDRAEFLQDSAGEGEAIADVSRCELCGKPKDRDDDEIGVDARDFATWMAALWWKDKNLASLVFARLMLPLAPLSELACLVGCSKATTTRLWQRLNHVAPMLAVWLRGAERRGGDRRTTPRDLIPSVANGLGIPEKECERNYRRVSYSPCRGKK